MRMLLAGSVVVIVGVNVMSKVHSLPAESEPEQLLFVTVKSPAVCGATPVIVTAEAKLLVTVTPVKLLVSVLKLTAVNSGTVPKL